MLENLESVLVAHKELITFFFTLTLILAGLASATIAYLSVRQLRKQLLFQEWASIRSILHDCQINLLEFEAKAAVANEQDGTVIDEAVATLNNVMGKIQKRVTEIEDSLSMNN